MEFDLPLQEWKVDHVVSWLGHMSMRDMIDSFRAAHVDGRRLETMDFVDVEKLAGRRAPTIWRAIQDLRDGEKRLPQVMPALPEGSPGRYTVSVVRVPYPGSPPWSGRPNMGIGGITTEDTEEFIQKLDERLGIGVDSLSVSASSPSPSKSSSRFPQLTSAGSSPSKASASSPAARRGIAARPYYTVNRMDGMKEGETPTNELAVANPTSTPSSHHKRLIERTGGGSVKAASPLRVVTQSGSTFHNPFTVDTWVQKYSMTSMPDHQLHAQQRASSPLSATSELQESAISGAATPNASALPELGTSTSSATGVGREGGQFSDREEQRAMMEITADVNAMKEREAEEEEARGGGKKDHKMVPFWAPRVPTAMKFRVSDLDAKLGDILNSYNNPYKQLLGKVDYVSILKLQKSEIAQWFKEEL